MRTADCVTLLTEHDIRRAHCKRVRSNLHFRAVVASATPTIATAIAHQAGADNTSPGIAYDIKATPGGTKRNSGATCDTLPA